MLTSLDLIQMSLETHLTMQCKINISRAKLYTFKNTSRYLLHISLLKRLYSSFCFVLLKWMGVIPLCDACSYC